MNRPKFYVNKINKEHEFIPHSSPRPRSQRWLYQVWYLFATTLSTSLQSLCYSVGKKQIKCSFQKSDHALPCPTLWFFKSKADGLVWKEESLLAAEDWTPKGTYIAEQKKKK